MPAELYHVVGYYVTIGSVQVVMGLFDVPHASVQTPVFELDRIAVRVLLKRLAHGKTSPNIRFSIARALPDKAFSEQKCTKCRLVAGRQCSTFGAHLV